MSETGAGLASASIDLTTLRQLRNESEGNAWCGVKPSVYGNQPCIHGDRFGQLDRLRGAIFQPRETAALMLIPRWRRG
ncbi:hypothetical protein [Acidiphilium sp.]|uniref:hypothetical protein n=1 Tax=Acidiphilium sp. TaxID=527 RepID=UPI0025880670|nr:hypothetical protein [Acidiphilium sp.]